MLVLHRKLHQKIMIGDNITIQIVDLPQGGVRLGITAPDGVVILREELVIKNQKQSSKKVGIEQ